MKTNNHPSVATDDRYGAHIDLARKSFEQKFFRAAMEHLRDAVSTDPARPEAYNIMGAVTEASGDLLTAQKYYRASLSIDPSYIPAQKNLARTVSWKSEKTFIV